MPRFVFECLHCGGKMEVNKQYGKIQCTQCGRFLDGSMPTEEAPAANADDNAEGASQQQDEARKTWVLGGLLYRGEMKSWMRTLVESLRAQLHMGQRAEAIRTCKRLLEMDRDFVDAHLWLARLSQAEETKRYHVGEVLARLPGNAEATRMLLVLNGELTEEEAARASNLYDSNMQTVEGEVETDTEALLCPLCRGTLTVSDDGGVVCAFCGYTDPDATNAVHPTRETSLAVALIKQRAKAIRWEVGERITHCNECGAERVLPPGKMAGRCPFCNSAHVMVEDNYGAFRQPDGIVRFRVRKKQAAQHLHEQLNSRVEKVKGWFIENRVQRIDYEGVFLPFWKFDIFGKVLIRDTNHDDENRVPDVQRQEIQEQLRHVLVPGVDSPLPELTTRLGGFDFGETIPYTPKLLARFAAELYQRDFASASLDARSQFRKAMLNKHHNPNMHVKRTIATQVGYMEMMLVLLPVWVVTILERDGDIRPALVNGQTGRVVLGKARRQGK